MKVQLEVNFCNNKTYLNYWDSMHGDDVCAELIRGDLVNMDGNIMSVAQFLSLVKTAAVKAQKE
jgi:hypothetical protein